MKILHVIDSEGFYGAETVLVDLVAEQKRLGIQATILNMRPCPKGEQSLEAAAGKKGLNFVIIPLKAGLDIRGAMRIVRFARNNHFDIIHSHGYKANILLGLMPKCLRKLPMVTTLHGWCSTKRFSKLWLFEQLDLLSLWFMDAVVVVNKSMNRHPYLRKQGLKIQVVNNGIPLIDFAKSSTLREQDIVDFCKKDGLVLGAIGRLSKEKNFALLLEVLIRLKKQGLDPYLVIIGEGGERPGLEMLIEKHGLGERVLLAGYRDGARNYISLFDLFLMPSLTEGLPITLLEAMQAEIPIVASAVGGIPEVLDKGKAGLLVNPKNVEELNNAIKRISEDFQLAEQLKKNAGKRVLEEYSCERMAEKYQQIYAKLLPV